VEYHCTAAGKVFLAFGSARLPAGPLPRRAADTVVDRGQLSAELERVRRAGWATACDELEPGLASIATPVPASPGPR
jgi:DNA-binding IclR family transcriptional regulator